MDSLLVTEYRPNTLDKILLSKNIKNILRNKIDNKTMDNILLSGKQGIGKCLIGDTFVFEENEGIKEIKEYDNNLENGFSKFNGSFLSEKNEFYNSSHFFKEYANKTILIKNNLNLELEGTYEHPIQIYDTETGKINDIQLKDIKEGDISIISRKNNVFTKKNIKLDNLKLNYHKNDNGFKIKNFDYFLDDKISKLLGYILANGCYYKNHFVISSTKKEILDDISQILTFYGIKINQKSKENIRIPLVMSKILLYFFDGKFKTARFKRIPKEIMISPFNVQCNFLQSLIDCDGYYSNKQSSLEYYTASEEMSKQVQIMLLNMSIISKRKGKYLKKYNHTYWTVSITGSEIEKYLNIIDTLKYNNIPNKNRNTNCDSIPNLGKILKNKINDIRTDLGVNKNGTFIHDNKRYRFKLSFIKTSGNNITFQHIKKSIKLLESEIGYFSNKKISDLLIFLKKIYKNNYYYSKIISIEKKKSNKLVYDLTIPKNHHFVSNGYISHNTSLARIIVSELDADNLYIHVGYANGVDIIRTKVKEFCDSVRMNDEVPKIVILDEADAMSIEGQKALRNIIELAEDDTRFILTCNYEMKIITPLKSRCTPIQLSCETSDILKMVVDILKEKKIEHSKETVKYFLDNVIKKKYPDIRAIINNLSLMIIDGKLSVENIEEKIGDIDIIADDILKMDKPREIRKYYIGSEDKFSSDYIALAHCIFNKLFEEPVKQIMVADAIFYMSQVLDAEIQFYSMILKIK